MPRTSAPLRRRALACAAAFGLLLPTACASDEDRTAPLPGADGAERDISFTVDGTEVFATLSLPEGASEEVPGALIVSGSGPTDRDGNSELRPSADTNLNLARVLAEAGVASLRYDKLGSGETGLGGHDPEEPVDPQVFDDQFAAAYEQLLSQPEIDPGRTLVVGHSEGALYALRAHELVRDEPALVLVAPPGTRYLDLVDRQLTEQVRSAEAVGQISEEEAVLVLSDARAGRAALRGGHALPDDLGDVAGSLYSEQNAEFLTRMDALDPVELASDLPPRTPVLVLWGEADAQVSREEVDRLMTGLADGERVDIPETDHVLRHYEDKPGATVLDSERPFAPEVSPALEDFVSRAW